MRKIFFFIAAMCCAVMMNATEGALIGRFTINDQGAQIRFSQGNLQYLQGSQTWQFAENQWNCLFAQSSQENPGNVIDLFGWGTGNQPILISEVYSDFATYAEWGNNAITNGGNEPGKWRTLTNAEWEYIATGRDNADLLRGQGIVNEVHGYIFLPDYFCLPRGLRFSPAPRAWLSTNTYTKEEWALMEAEGAVFLPSGSFRRATGSVVEESYHWGYYWSCTSGEESTTLSDSEKKQQAGYISFTNDGLKQTSFTDRRQGASVRLVVDADSPQPQPTKKDDPDVTTGGEVKKIGTFSIAKGKKVTFSQGNLQYRDSTRTFRFAEHQWDCIGQDNNRIGRNSGFWIDLLQWGAGDKPWRYTNRHDSLPAFVDWGTNPIANGGDEAGYWRTLNYEEWEYIYHKRDNAYVLHGAGVVNGVTGMIILPDQWSTPRGLNFTPRTQVLSNNTYTKEEWALMETEGAVFLPYAGYRRSSDLLVSGVNTTGWYWTASSYADYVATHPKSANATNEKQDAMHGNAGDGYCSGYDKRYGMAVRLVRDTVVVEPETTPNVPFDTVASEIKEFGSFSVSKCRQVTFSQGNLQYQESTGIYRFAENQYDVIGEENRRIGRHSTYWIDLFGWGTGNWPSLYSDDYGKYPDFKDWGHYPIENGGKKQDMWRTLTEKEWYYLLKSRKNADKLRSWITINGVHGFVILPDDWVLPEGMHLQTSGASWNFDNNTYTLEEWAIMEAAGAVFLPAAGSRQPNDLAIEKVNTSGSYWSASSFLDYFPTSTSTSDIEHNACGFSFSNDYMGGTWSIPANYDKRYGWAVRLVRDVPLEEPVITTDFEDPAALSMNVSIAVEDTKECVSIYYQTVISKEPFNMSMIQDDAWKEYSEPFTVTPDIHDGETLYVTILSYAAEGDRKSTTAQESFVFIQPKAPDAPVVEPGQLPDPHQPSVRVSISAEEGAQIFYTLLRRTYNESGSMVAIPEDTVTKLEFVLYEKPFEIVPEGEEGDRYAMGVIAYAVKNKKQSEYGFGLYEFEIPVTPDKPTISVDGGKQLPNKKYEWLSVDFSAEEDAQIYYASQELSYDEQGALVDTLGTSGLEFELWNKISGYLSFRAKGETGTLSAYKVFAYAERDGKKSENAEMIYELEVPEPVCPEVYFMDTAGEVVDTVHVVLGEEFVAPHLDSKLVSANYRSDDEKVSVVDGEGKVQILAAGTVSIHAENILIMDSLDHSRCPKEYFEALRNVHYTIVVTEPEPEELEPLPNDEETTFDFSLYDPNGEEMLGITLGAQDSFNEEEGCVEVASTNTAEEVDAKLNEAFEGAASLKSLLPGTITFELEPGGGEIEIDCKTVPGYSLYVRIAEYGAAYISSTIEQAMRGKASVTYEVHQKTFVVIYLDGVEAASAPARIARADGEEGAGAYIYAISVKPKNIIEGVDQVQGDDVPCTKFIHDGQLLILRGDCIYTVTGQEVK